MQQMMGMAPQISSGLGAGQGSSGTVSGGRSASSPQAGGSIGGGFVPFGQYAAGNVESTQRLGDQVAGQISGAGEKARGALSSGLEAFGNRVNEGSTGISDGTLIDLQNDPGRLVKDELQRDQVIKARDATYRGPNALEETEEFGNISSALAEARQTRDLAGSRSGVSQLADQTVKAPRTLGERQFDTELLNQNQGARDKIESARTGLNSLEQEQTQASESARNTAAQGRKLTDQTREKTRGILATAQDALQKSLDGRVDVARQQAAQRQQAVRDALAQQENRGALSTVGRAGYYGEAGTGARTESIAGKVPRLIHNGAGQGAVAPFQQFLQTRAGAGPGQDVLDALGITPEQWAALNDLAPVGQFAAAGASGTNNVNPEVFLEDFEERQNLGRFASYRDPNAEIQRRNIATGDDYDRLAALDLLAGTQSTGLNAAERGKFDLSDDLVDFDGRGAALDYMDILDALASRTGNTVAGNRRSGGDTFIKKHGAQILSGGILPRGAEFNLDNYKQAVLGSLIGQDAGSGRINSSLTADDLKRRG